MNGNTERSIANKTIDAFRLSVKLHRYFLFAAVIGILTGCSKPNLPTEPPRHVALKAIVAINGKAYPFDFTWTEENYVAWNEAVFWHTEWKSSETTCVRILDSKYAVVVWLPSCADTNLEQFRPNFALLDRDNPHLLRSYPALKTAEKRDAMFEVEQLALERSTNSFGAKPMTKEEESLKKDIVARRYGYLYGMYFDKEQWSRSPDLSRLLPAFKDFTPLGKRAQKLKDESEVWLAFSTFNARTVGVENRHLFGFELSGESWVPLPYAGVYCYQEGLGEAKEPVLISYGGHIVDQQQNEMFFDEMTKRLVVVWRYGLDRL